MDFLQALLLSVVQGITEFLPISSSAHLVFIPQLMGWNDQGIVFDISVHIGTLLAVIFYFRKDMVKLLKAILTFDKSSPDFALAFKLILSTLPIVIFALLLKDLVELWGRMLPILATSSIVFGILLWWADKYKPCSQSQLRPMESITWRESLIFGLFQALALVPGTSRSGICVTAGRFLGFSRSVSGQFSSLLAIPTIMIAAVYSLTKVDTSINWQSDAHLLLLGVTMSAITAFLGIHVLMTWLTRIGYFPFMVYRVLLGAGLWIWFLSV